MPIQGKYYPLPADAVELPADAVELPAEEFSQGSCFLHAWHAQVKDPPYPTPHLTVYPSMQCLPDFEKHMCVLVMAVIVWLAS